VSDLRSEPVAGAGEAASKALALVIEDESPMRKLLRVALVSHGYRVLEATTGAEALRMAMGYAPDVILLDLGLPDIDGIALVKQLREWATIPVIVVSARPQEQTRVEVLDAGADDFVAKPFGVDELLARIRVALRHAVRRTEGAPSASIQVGDLRMDFARRLAFVGPEELHLTPTEYRLLAMLMQHAGTVLTHNELLRGVWGPGHDRDAQYLRVYVGQLRRKLEPEPARPRYLITEAGVGYRIKAPPRSSADGTDAGRPGR
jgi:two-component system, OmpR family, KDP operon response regulator KdpE